MSKEPYNLFDFKCGVNAKASASVLGITSMQFQTRAKFTAESTCVMGNEALSETAIVVKR